MYENELERTAAANTLLPVSRNERIAEIDVLRGVAIFGVLIAYAMWNLGSPPASTWTTADTIVNWTLEVIVNSKAYTLLAFLFGVGFSIQLTRAEERGASIVPVYCRRLFAMMLIGGLHALLLRNGDILVPYAVMGFVLLLFRNVSDKTLIALALVGSFASIAAEFIWSLTGIPFPTRPKTDGMSHLASNYLWVKYWYATAITIWPGSLPMFFAGLYVGRKPVFENVAAYKKAFRWLLGLGLVVGVGVFVGRLLLIGAIGQVSSSWKPVIGLLIVYSWSVHGWALAAAYASTLLLLLQRTSWQRALSPFAAVGQMALTNYLLQAAVIVPICIVFDLYDKVTPIFGLAMALALFAAQVPFSVLWLRHFRFGPAEWVWRSMTYKKPQPLRRVPGESVVGVGHVSSAAAVTRSLR